MSDSSTAQSSMLAALGRCTGGPGCPCGEEASPLASPAAASPLRSSSSATSRGNSGDSSAATASPEPSESDGLSVAAIPVGYPVQEWAGLRRIRVGKCEHGRRCILKKCWGGKDTGRRFLGCPVKDVKQQCGYVEWLDAPWPERAEASFKKLSRQLMATHEVQAASQNSLIEAYKSVETWSQERTKLKKDADSAIDDKNKIMFLVYGLVGVIFLQLVLFFVKI